MNEKGNAFPESILVLSIVTLIFATLLPLGTHQYKVINNKKLAVYAAETIFQAAIQYKTKHLTSGSKYIDGIEYLWYVNEHSICVEYVNYSKTIQKCVHY